MKPMDNNPLKPMDGDIVEELLEKPYYIIDILPWQVAADSEGQYFKMARYFLRPPQKAVIVKKFCDIIIKLNCYYDLSLYQDTDQHTDNPPPEFIEECMASGIIVHAVVRSENAMVSYDGDDHYMTLYNPSDRLLRLVTALAGSVGLFVWKNNTQRP